MVDTVKAALDRCSKGGDPSEVVAKLALDQNMSSEEAARVCEAVNKVASINYLSDSRNDRSATFPLANSAEVVQMMKDSMKVAKDPFKFRKTASDGLVRVKDKMKLVTDEERAKYAEASAKAEYSSKWLDVQAAGLGLKQASEELRLHEYKLNDEFIALVDKIASMPQEEAEDFANYAVMAHGQNGLNFLTALENLTGSKYDRTERPFVKTGSDAENSLDLFIKHADQVMALRDVLGFVKTAAAGGNGGGKTPKDPELSALQKEYDKIDEGFDKNLILAKLNAIGPKGGIKLPAPGMERTDKPYMRAAIEAWRDWKNTRTTNYKSTHTSGSTKLPTAEESFDQNLEEKARQYNETKTKNTQSDNLTQGRKDLFSGEIPVEFMNAAKNDPEVAVKLWEESLGIQRKNDDATFKDALKGNPSIPTKYLRAAKNNPELAMRIWNTAQTAERMESTDTLNRARKVNLSRDIPAQILSDAKGDPEAAMRLWTDKQTARRMQTFDNTGNGRGPILNGNIPANILRAANNDPEAAMSLWAEQQQARRMARADAYNTADSIDVNPSWVSRADVDREWASRHGGTPPTAAERKSDEYNGLRRELSNAEQQEAIDSVNGGSYLTPRQRHEISQDTSDERLKLDNRTVKDTAGVHNALDQFYGGGNHVVAEALQRAQEHKEDRDFVKSQRTAAGVSKTISNVSDLQDRVGQALHETISGAINNTQAGLAGAIGILQKADALRKGLQAPQLSGNKYSDPLSLEATKYMESLDMHDLFAKAYLSDPYLRQFAPSEVAEAFNIVHEVAPEIINSVLL